ncbi:hypothetical protein N9L68_02045 [bacterium]|nr:hypothetical protein [bacterium]
MPGWTYAKKTLNGQGSKEETQTYEGSLRNSNGQRRRSPQYQSVVERRERAKGGA